MKYPPPLSADEQIVLCQKAQAGDARARDRLVATSMRFVVMRARYFANRTPGADIDDFVNCGAVGLMKALEKFDPAKGAGFIGYASNWVDAAIRRDGVNFEREVSATDASRTRLHKEYRAACAKGLDHEAALASVVSADGHVRLETVRGVVDALQRQKARSLDAPLNSDGDGVSLGDMLASTSPDQDAALGRADERARIEGRIARLRDRLDERDIAILDKRLLADGDESTLGDIAKEFGLSRERIRQLEAKLLRKLRRSLAGLVDRNVRSRDYMRELRAEKKTAGLCMQCAEPVRRPGAALCDLHHKRVSDLATRRARRRGRKPRRFRYLTLNGETRCLAEWAKRTGLTPQLILWRLRTGWPIDKVLTTVTKIGLRQKPTCKRGHVVADVGLQKLCNGSFLCRACSREVYAPKQAASRRRRREERLAAGLCLCKRPVKDGRRSCQDCLDRATRNKRAFRDRQSVSRKNEAA